MNCFKSNILKRGCAVLLTLVMLLSLTPLSAMAADSGHWSAAAVKACEGYGILDSSDKSYDPDDVISRAEFCAMINLAFNFTETDSAKTFPDVNYSGKFGNDMKIASAMGYMNGYGNTAGPGDPLTREQAFTILARIYALSGDAKAKTRFVDDADISDWARAAINAMSKAGYVNGVGNGRLDPKTALTKGQSAQILYNLFGMIVDKSVSETATYKNLTIRKGGVTVKNATVTGDLFITAGVGAGDVKLENVTIMGRTLVSGGGSASVEVVGGDLGDVVINSGYNTHLNLSGGAAATGILMDSTSSVTQGGATISYDAQTGKVTLGGAIDKISLNADGSAFVTIGGIIYDITPIGTNGNKAVSSFALAADAVVKSMSVSGKAAIGGTGKIESMEIHSAGVVIDSGINVDPNNVKTDKDVIVKIGGKDYKGDGQKSVPVTTPSSSGGGGGSGGGGSTTTSVTLSSATADGSAGTATSTKIDLIFSRSITGLTANDITITNGSGSATKGTLSGSGTNWSIALTNVSEGNVSVSVASPAGYSVSGSPKTVNVYKAAGPVSITLNSATADGASGTTTSTKIDLVFSAAISGLAASDITITNGTGAATKGALTGSGTNWSIALTSVTTEGNVSVAVASPAGYAVTGSPKTVTVYKAAAAPVSVTLSSATADGSAGTATSTKIDLIFSAAITGLTASDITITGGTGAATKGALTGSGTNWSIAISGVSEGNVSVAVASPAGYTINGSPKTVAVYKAAAAPISVTLNSATADGASGTTTSTKIDLVFSAAISGLAASDITITNGTGAATKGALTGSGTNWSIAISNVSEGNVSVAVASPAGYTVTGSPKAVAVYKAAAAPVSVTLSSATADGAAGTTTSTKIDLVFSAAITGLTASDITITGGTGAATKGALTGSGTNWSIAISSVSEGNVSIAVASPAGYTVTGSPKTVAVYKDSRIYPTSVEIATEAVIPVTGGSSQLNATITPAGANTDTAITWSSSAPGVATVSSSGLVTAVSAGTATITATTANGKSDTCAVTVKNDVTALSYTKTGLEMKLGDTIKLAAPTVTPSDSYNALTYTSGSPSVAQILYDEASGYSIKGLTAGTAVITATSHNGKTAQFTMAVKSPLTNAQIPATHTMDVNAYWTVPVTLTPASGAYENYVLTTDNPDIVRIEQNIKVYSIKPGTASVKVSIDGVEKGSCTVTVSSPVSSSNVGLKYYNVKYKSDGKATVTLGIVPVAGAVDYVVTEHVTDDGVMDMVDFFADENVRKDGSVFREWVFTAAEATAPLDFVTETGLRFYSVYARDINGDPINNHVAILHVPVLYYPRYFGGASEAGSDGMIVPFVTALYMVDVVFGGGIFLPAAVTPYNIQLAFDKVPGAAGYDIYCVSNGKDWGSEENIPQPSGNRVTMVTDYVIEEGETIFYVLPYVYGIDGTTKLYGEMRTVVFKLKGVPLGGLVYWETSTEVLDPTLTIKNY